jgi:hypothetical protein
LLRDQKEFSLFRDLHGIDNSAVWVVLDTPAFKEFLQYYMAETISLCSTLIALSEHVRAVYLGPGEIGIMPAAPQIDYSIF